MPNIITHKLFAEKVEEKLTKYDIKQMIKRHSQLYYIGSNGPDFLFFSHAKPWESYKDHKLNHLGSRMHSVYINDFYGTAIRCIKEQKNEEIKESMLVYLFGHLCHWALDKTTHPYIFYRTGDCKGVSSGYHHRFESMLDTMLLEDMKGMSIKDYHCSAICHYDTEMLKAIARIYVPVAKEVYHVDIKVHEIREALDSWRDIQELLYDPNNIKFTILKSVERVIHKPWLISGNIVKSQRDDRYDVLNLEKKTWKHPCDDTILSNASFMELFDDAVYLALHVIEKTYGCVEYDADVLNVLNVLKDEAYDTGMANETKMQYFDIIYEE